MRWLAMALRSVCVTARWPITSSKRCGRHFLARTLYDTGGVVEMSCQGRREKGETFPLPSPFSLVSEAGEPHRDPEAPAAHFSDCLALLPSGPDAVRRLRLHRVRIAVRPAGHLTPPRPSRSGKRKGSHSPASQPVSSMRPAVSHRLVTAPVRGRALLARDVVLARAHLQAGLLHLHLELVRLAIEIRGLEAERVLAVQFVGDAREGAPTDRRAVRARSSRRRSPRRSSAGRDPDAGCRRRCRRRIRRTGRRARIPPPPIGGGSGSRARSRRPSRRRAARAPSRPSATGCWS